MQLKYLVYIATLATSALAASPDVAQEALQGISMLRDKLVSFTQKFNEVSTSTLGLRLIPGMRTDIHYAKAYMDKFMDTSKSVQAGSITPEECEKMIVPLRQMQESIDSSFKVFATYKPVMDNLPSVGLVTPRALRTLLHFKQYGDNLRADFIPKLPANCTAEVESIAAHINDATTSVINAYST